ncbi:uncharacterized protein LOC127747539 [Arachis duranensis]|uniref:Uncharacterized protein LOC107478170 n=1 Tax=Arachis duranensis TaxID=130453 RepID=A0A6P4CNL4_ARADU|nr:uncharacterized protein LOC107478170 [Arachis duranensis]XP_052117506.1 uncharacterized protein LOC127747539 [Arachis duranensis]
MFDLNNTSFAEDPRNIRLALTTDGHRRFLNQRHRFRLNRVRFNGEQEFRNPPKRLSGLDILEQVKDINVTFGRKEEAKVREKRRRDERATEEKNVCDNVIYTLLNDSTKSKDHLNARKDLKALGSKQDLWPDENEKKLCDKRLIIKDLDKLQDQIVLTLCHMEMLFPPSFFTVMIYLVVHLVEEVKLGVLYLGQIKSYVRNKAQPEGYITEDYLMQEILTFCSRYLDNIKTIWNRRKRVSNEPTYIDPNLRISKLFPQVGESNIGFTYFTLAPIEKRQAHRHVLTNCRAVDNYFRDYRDIVKKRLRSQIRDTTKIDKKVHRKFVDWFSNHICTNLNKLPDVDKDILISLSQGPYDQARKDNGLKTHNSGVFGTFGTRSYSNSKDTRMNFGAVPYYEKLVDIIELFYNGFIVLLFKCQWAKTTSPRGIKKDNLSFLSVNFTKLIHTGEHEDDEPYIKASETQIVYYVDDEKKKGWCIPIHLKS